MRVLVTGGTGKLGIEVVKSLLKKGAEVSVLTRKPDSKLPEGAELIVGDLTDPLSVLPALSRVDKLFLLVGNVADELTQALLTFNLARECKIKPISYLSVYQAERFPEVPHFICKNTVESAFKAFNTPYTILRPGYFFQNDNALKVPLTTAGLYVTPIGKAGLAAVDCRDIADGAAASLCDSGHEGKTYNMVGPDALSGPEAAKIWGKALGKEVKYPEISLDKFEAQLRQFMPSWHAMDLRLMMESYEKRGFAPGKNDTQAMEALIGHSARTYESFVRETVAGWAN